jgi:hypothetical protein
MKKYTSVSYILLSAQKLVSLISFTSMQHSMRHLRVSLGDVILSFSSGRICDSSAPAFTLVWFVVGNAPPVFYVVHSHTIYKHNISSREFLAPVFSFILRQSDA